jgi:rod shape-determining protein MreC
MSRRLPISRKPLWITLTLVLAIHIGLISFQGRRHVDTGFVRVWMLDSLAPMEKAADRLSYGVRHVWERYIALIGVHDENQRLKRENDELRMQLIEQREAVLEAARIRELTALDQRRLGKSIVARVIGRDPARSQTITIDKGAVHGLRPDVAVVTTAGVVGRVIHTSNFFSIVQLIVDSQSAVGVMLQSSRLQGIVKGTGGRNLELDYIDDDNELKTGDAFLSSGADRIYPKGLPVGVITSIGPRRGLIKAVEIRPSVDFGRLEEVLCIIERREDTGLAEPVTPSATVP